MIFSKHSRESRHWRFGAALSSISMPHFPCAYIVILSDPAMLMLSLLLPLAGVSAEPACLLQKPKAPTQLSLLAQPPVPGWEYAGKGDCALLLLDSPQPDPMSCASFCVADDPFAIAFSYGGGQCFCCQGLDLNPGSTAFAYVGADPLWQFLGVGPGVGTSCSSPALSSPSTPLNACALVCGIDQWLLYRGAGPSQACDCCATANLVDSGSPDHFVYYSKVPGWVYVGLGSCDADPIYTTPSASGPNQCANECSTKPAATGFYYVVGSQLCHCCSRVRVGANPDPTIVPGYVYVRDVRRAPSRLLRKRDAQTTWIQSAQCCFHVNIALHQSRKRICFSTKMGFEQEQQKRYNRKHKYITWSYMVH